MISFVEDFYASEKGTKKLKRNRDLVIFPSSIYFSAHYFGGKSPCYTILSYVLVECIVSNKRAMSN